MSETEQKSTDQKEQKETTKEVLEPVKEDQKPEVVPDSEVKTEEKAEEVATEKLKDVTESVSSDTTWEAVSKWIENKSNQSQLNSISVKVAARQEVLKPKPHSGSGLMLNK